MATGRISVLSLPAAMLAALCISPATGQELVATPTMSASATAFFPVFIPFAILDINGNEVSTPGIRNLGIETTVDGSQQSSVALNPSGQSKCNLFDQVFNVSLYPGQSATFDITYEEYVPASDTWVQQTESHTVGPVATGPTPAHLGVCLGN